MAGNNSALVTYASWQGSTVEVAEAIRDSLQSSGFCVDLKPAKSVSDPGSYDQVVAGSAVRMGKTHPDFGSLLGRHHETLTGAKLAAFIVCGTLKEKSETSCGKAEAVLASGLSSAPELSPIATATFAGAIDRGKPSWPFRLMFRINGEKGGDWRDWDAIDSRAQEVAKKVGDG